MSQLTDLLSRRSLAMLADAGSFVRGGAYASDGRVEDLEMSSERARAVVRGTVPYAVELWMEPSAHWAGPARAQWPTMAGAVG